MADLSEQKKVIGFIGAGNMASALIRGLVGSGMPPKQLLVSDLDQEKTALLVADLGVQARDVTSLVVEADVIILAVKPGSIAAIARQHAAHAPGRLWMSVAAGVSTATIEAALGGDARVVRAMPNTPALVNKGATGLAPGSRATEEDMSLARDLMSAVGICESVDESMMDAVTAVSGSGPAFVMLVIESMADGGVRAGLPRATALKLAAQTVYGSAALLLSTGKHPGELKDMVTSPGGTTIAGIEALESGGLRGTLISAVAAAAARSRALSGS